MKNIIGIDFSIVKPAACIYDNKQYIFYSWVKNISNKNFEKFIESKINISIRKNIENKDIVRYDLINSDILSDMIIKDLRTFINKNTIFVFEGASFASRGNVLISLSVWKYILMYKLLKLIPIDNLFTYAPITIKKTAGCSKKGMGKKEMIDAFVRDSASNNLKSAIISDPDKFKKKTGNWIDHLDDLIDAYWTVETYQNKVNKLI